MGIGRFLRRRRSGAGREGLRQTFQDAFLPRKRRPTVAELRARANAAVRARHGGEVAFGEFAGLRLSDDPWWGGLDASAKILGAYESQVVREVAALSGRGRMLVDIGAADGFFAVGALVGNLFDRVTAFEISDRGRAALTAVARLNGVENRIDIQAEADAAALARVVGANPDAVVLCDIEGAEFDLFDDALLATLAGCSVIIELHGPFDADGAGRRHDLRARALRHFDCRLLHRDPIPVDAFDALADLDDATRLLAFGEGRKRRGEWLVLTPRAAT